MWERDLIRTRTAEGRSRAKAQGKHMGRPPSLTHIHHAPRHSCGMKWLKVTFVARSLSGYL